MHGLATFKDPNGRLAKWALRSQEFDIEIIYKSGGNYLYADCLSRNLPLPEDFSLDVASINILVW